MRLRTVPPVVEVTVDLGPCQSGYCDEPAVAYVSRTLGSSPRFLVILGRRAEELGDGIEGAGSPLALRCLDCAHDELDKARQQCGVAINHVPSSR